MLRIVTNDLDAPAQEIADLYKQRWQIELFFRWIKQTLRIKCFIGVSENAVPGGAKDGAEPPRVRPTRAHKSHAQTSYRPAARTSSADRCKSKSVEAWPILHMNRTAVGLSRPSTSFLL